MDEISVLSLEICLATIGVCVFRCGSFGCRTFYFRKDFNMAKCKLCGTNIKFALLQYYVPDISGEKHQVCKNCSQKVGENNAVQYDPVTDSITIVNKIDVEVRKMCNVCGKVFCYNHTDLEKNKEKAKNAKWSTLGQLGGAMSGNYAASAVYGMNANNSENQIIDYNKCPHCGSLDLREISKSEYQTTLSSNQNPTAVSTAEELKKFKDLLDSGIITQEEFDAKKKQLLGL